MFRARFRDVQVERVSLGEESVELVSAESSLFFAGPGFSWGLSYLRPLRVESPMGSVAIRDHVMLARLAAIAIAFVLTIRRFTT